MCMMKTKQIDVVQAVRSQLLQLLCNRPSLACVPALHHTKLQIQLSGVMQVEHGPMIIALSKPIKQQPPLVDVSTQLPMLPQPTQQCRGSEE